MPFDTQTAPVTSVSAADLHGAMVHLIRAIETRFAIPALHGVCITRNDAGLTFRTTDLDLQITVTLDCDGDGEQWAALVNAKSLHKLLTKTKGKSDTVILSPCEDSGALVTIGKTRVTLQAQGIVSDFPELVADTDKCSAPAWRTTLADVFTRPAFAISTEQTRYYLGGIYLHQIETADGLREEMRAVATDGHRMAHFETGIALPPMPGGGQIVPRKAVDIIGRVLTAKGMPDNARVSFNATKCKVTCGNVEVITKAIDGTFPDYTRVVPDRTAGWRIDRAEMLDALNASLVMGDRNGSPVKVTLGHDVSEIECSGNDGTASQHFSATASETTEHCATRFNSAYLKDALTAFKDAEAVVFSQTSSGDPARFEVSGDPLLIVVMPMRV